MMTDDRCFSNLSEFLNLRYLIDFLLCKYSLLSLRVVEAGLECELSNFRTVVEEKSGFFERFSCDVVAPIILNVDHKFRLLPGAYDKRHKASRVRFHLQGMLLAFEHQRCDVFGSHD